MTGLAVMWLAHFADAWTTMLALQVGCRELNPIIAYLLTVSMGWMFVYKAGCCALMTGLILAWRRRGGGRFGLVVWTMAGFGAAIWNVWVIPTC